MEQTSTLVSDLLERNSTNVRNDCGFSRLRTRMQEVELEALDRAVELIKLDNGSGKAKVYSCQWLTEVLNKHGYKISSSTISRHLSGRCSCE